MQIYGNSKKIYKMCITLFLFFVLLSSLHSQEKVNSKEILNTNQDSKERKEIIKKKVFSPVETALFTFFSIYALSRYNPELQAAENAKQMRNTDFYILLLKYSTNSINDFSTGVMIADAMIFQDPNIGYFRHRARESLQYSSVFAFLALLGFFWEKEVVVQSPSNPPSASNYRFQPILKTSGKDFELGFMYRF